MATPPTYNKYRGCQHKKQEKYNFGQSYGFNKEI